MASQREKEPKGMRKPVPHGRSFSLQMLTNRPTSAPLQDEMYTETLQPMRSPPGYSDQGEESGLAPPLAYSVMSPQNSTRTDSQITTDQSSRRFYGDAAVAGSFVSTTQGKRDRGARAVSMPIKTSSPYDSMFTFSTQLPENLSRTLVVPESTPDSTATISSQARAQSPLPFASQRVYSPEGMRMSYISDGRRSASGTNSPLPFTRNGTDRPSSGSRKSSMLNTLGGWLEKRQDSNRSNQDNAR